MILFFKNSKFSFARISYRLSGTLVVVGLFTASCRHPFPQRMEQAHETTRQRWQQLAHQPRPTIAYLDWDEAIIRLENSSFKLQEAREVVRVAKAQWEKLPRNFIPELNLNLISSPTLEEASGGDFTSTYFQIGGLLDLPTPWRYKAQSFQAQLQYALAQTKLEILRREQYVALYRLFRNAQLTSRKEKEHEAFNKISRTSQSEAYHSQMIALRDSITKEWHEIGDYLAELINDQTHRWLPDGQAKLPTFDYADHPPSIDGEDGFAALQLTHTALQLVAVEASRQGLLLSSWPRFSVLISAPPIYQSTSGNSSFLSLEDLRISPFVAYSTDFRGRRKMAREQNARRSAITLQQLDLAMQTTLLRLRDTADLLTQLAQQRDRLVKAYRGSSTLTIPQDIQSKLDELDSQIEELNLTFWIFDTSRWHPAG